MRLLIAAALLLALSAASLASAVSLLPFYGRALVDVELVCRNSTVAAPSVYSSSMVSAFHFQMTYSAGSLYPFYVERMETADNLRTYYISASEKYTLSDNSWCVTSTESNIEDPDVWVALALRNILHSPLPTSFTTGTTRGIAVHNYTNQLSLLIPAAYGGLDTTTTYNAVILTTVSQWTVNLMEDIEQTILSVELTSSSLQDPINNCLFTFTFYGANMSDSLSTSAPAECSSTSGVKAAPRGRLAGAAAAPSVRAAQMLTESSSSAAGASSTTAGSSASAAKASSSAARASSSAAGSSSSAAPTTTAAPNTNTLYAMPDFPQVFTANFFVISPSQRAVYQIREAFDPFSQVSRATLDYPTAGAAGRVYDYEWSVSGYDQMSYYHETFAVPNGQETISKAVRQYFWPDTDKCTKLLIGYDLMATSVETLLLQSRTAPATFIGNETVRNIPCGVWAADANGVRVTWYWATPGQSNVASFTTPSTDNAETTYGTLVRMTVTGTGGASPLFAHHPFFPQGYSFPAVDRMTACEKLAPSATEMSCHGWSRQQNFSYIYDITSFVPYVRVDDYSLSDTCYSASVSGSIPSFSCSYGGVTGGVVAVLLVIVSALFGVMGGSCVWCRYSRMVRRQQEELMRLTQEMQSTAAPEDAAGGASAWSSGAGYARNAL